jgi:hypothetical protein
MIAPSAMVTAVLRRVRPRLPAVAVRLAVLPFALIATVLVPHPGAALFAVVVVGVLLAAAVPAAVGAFVVLAADVMGWAVGYGTDTTPPVLRTALFAIALYLVHASAALAGSVPVAADLRPDVVTAFAYRCLPGIAIAVVVGVLVATLGDISGSLGLDVVGFAGVLVTGAAVVWLVRGREPDRRALRPGARARRSPMRRADPGNGR